MLHPFASENYRLGDLACGLIVKKIVEDEEVDFTHRVWDKLFASGNPLCVKRYLRKYYPKLESKV